MGLALIIIMIISLAYLFATDCEPLIKILKFFAFLFYQIKSQKTMNTTALLRALKFVCIPTLSLLVLLFFAFFSVSKTIAFISSDDGWAIALRIIAFIAEIVLVVWKYLEYNREEIFKSGNKGEYIKEKGSSCQPYYEIRQILGHDKRGDYRYYQTTNVNIKILEFIPKTD